MPNIFQKRAHVSVWEYLQQDQRPDYLTTLTLDTQYSAPLRIFTEQLICLLAVSEDEYTAGVCTPHRNRGCKQANKQYSSNIVKAVIHASVKMQQRALIFSVLLLTGLKFSLFWCMIINISINKTLMLKTEGMQKTYRIPPLSVLKLS